MSDQPQYPTYPDYQQPQYPQYPPAPPPSKGGMGKWIALGGCGCLLFLAVLAGVGFFVYQMVTKAPTQAVNTHLAALREGNVEKAYDECSSGFKQATSLKQFQSFVSGYPFFKDAKEFSSSNAKSEGGITTLEGNVECTDGSKHPAEYRVVREGTTYRVQYINVKEASTPPPSEESTTKQNEGESTQKTSEEQPSGNLRIFDVQVNKTQQGNMVSVVVAFQVEGFKNDHSGDSYSLNLVQDLETLGPDGNKVSSLSQDAIKTLSESGAAEYTSANFSNTLSIPTSFPHGTYTINLKVHDEIGGAMTSSSTTFELP